MAGIPTTAWHARSGDGPNIRTWVGGLVDDMRDASGQMYRRNRYYDPQTGQFTQPDPIGLAGGLNAYGFAEGDPVSYSDPYGLCPKALQVRENVCPGGLSILQYEDIKSGAEQILLGEARTRILTMLDAGDIVLTGSTGNGRPAGADWRGPDNIQVTAAFFGGTDDTGYDRQDERMWVLSHELGHLIQAEHGMLIRDLGDANARPEHWRIRRELDRETDAVQNDANLSLVRTPQLRAIGDPTNAESSRTEGSAMKPTTRFQGLCLLMVMAMIAGCRLPRPGPGAEEVPAERTRSEMVSRTVRALSALVGFVDAFGRPSGRLPPELGPVLEQRQRNGYDAWGQAIRYSAHHRRFELRSAGPDTTFGTPDDLLAVGVLGRNVPCEMRSGERVITYDHLAPPCDFSPGARVFPTCPALLQYRPAEVATGDLRDSVLATGRRLVRFARALDGAARELGGLPPTVRSVPSHPRVETGWDLADVWGNAIRYTRGGTEFELRSAGSDGTFDTNDDLVVEGELGRVVPCEFKMEQGIARCDDLPPPCPTM